MNCYAREDGSYYMADMPLDAADKHVLFPPAGRWKYNHETSQWEELPPTEEPRDLTIAEAEQLYAEAQNGSMAAQLLIRWEDL